MQKIDNIGRITIPKNLRDNCNLEKGTECELVATNEGILIMSKNKNYSVGSVDMDALRKLYIMLKNSGFIDDYYDEILSRITRKTDSKCTKCGEHLFLTNDNNYKCFNCE